MNPNLKQSFLFRLWGGGGGGARVSEFFFTESKSTKRNMFFLRLGGRRGGRERGRSMRLEGGWGAGGRVEG